MIVPDRGPSTILVILSFVLNLEFLSFNFKPGLHTGSLVIFLLCSIISESCSVYNIISDVAILTWS